MSKRAPWTIRVGRKAETIAEFDVPSHKLGIDALREFLRALVARYRADEPESMVSYYVNRRRGPPDRLPFADIQIAHDPERGRVGYFCGTWECYAYAMQAAAPDVAAFLRRMIPRSCD